MSEAYRSETQRRLLDAIPDRADTVDFRGLLLRDDVWIVEGTASEQAWVYGSDPVELACGWGALTDELLREAMTSRPTLGLVVPDDAPAFPYLEGRRVGTCVLHDLGPGVVLPEKLDLPAGVEIASWAEAPPDALDHAPPDLQEEITGAARRCGVSAVHVDGLPVSFCYAHHESETFWDVSVDTLEPYRRRGLSRLSFLHRARINAAQGLRPAWGALTDNEASNGMARSLGFVPTGQVRYYFSESASSRPGAGSDS